MKCANPNCDGEWNSPSGKSLTLCPFCQEPVAEEKKTPPSFDHVAETLVYIKEQHGVDMLLGKNVDGLFADLTRNRLRDEKDLIKQLCEKGTLDFLKAAIGQPESEHEFAIKRALSKLPKYLKDSPAVAEMLFCFAEALGWKVPKAQDAVQDQAPPLPGNIPPNNQSSPKGSGIIAPLAGSVMRFAGIDWRVLAVENNKALLLSEKVLEQRPYNTELVDITWENCTLRQYLNHDFYNNFGAEKSAIAETHNDNPNNLWYGTYGGNATTDKIFLLSLEEADKYFGDSGDYINKRRKDYNGKSDSKGYWIHNTYNKNRIANYGNEGAWWWLRSPGDTSDNAANVRTDGTVHVYGSNVHADSVGVRPALWLNL